jgi:hypothetical protein
MTWFSNIVYFVIRRCNAAQYSRLWGTVKLTEEDMPNLFATKQDTSGNWERQS